MDHKDIELRSEKARNIIGKMPRRLAITAISVYLLIFIIILVLINILDIENTSIFNHILGK